MFTQRFNELLTDICGVAPGEFARLTGYDRSYVSHLRSGDRVPKAGRRAAERLTRAICVCAEKRGVQDALRRRVGAPESADAAALRAAVSAWLFDGEGAAERKTAPKPRSSRSSFGSRLEPAMELAGVSAGRLARSVSVDASLIAKYRSGVRVPKMNHPIIRALAAALAVRIYALGRTEGLARLIAAPQAALADESDGARALEAWLRDFSAVDTSVIENLLEGMDAITAAREAPPIPWEAAGGTALHDAAAYYDGTEGLRRAVLRFLAESVGGGQRELLLYSDQNMEWMLGDRDFMARWASLMSAYVSGGGKIRIIHNVDRGLEEMVGAIRSWLPLYLSGGVESWYSLRGGGERFSHTLFLAPDRACVTGVCAAGGERHARYRYVTDAAGLAHCRAVYDDLLAECRPLLKMSVDGGAEQLRVMSRERDVHLVTRSISLETMPEPLLDGILRRAALSAETRRLIRSDWTERRRLLLEQLARGSVNECVALPTEETLRAGGVAVDTAYAALRYTPEEYAAHLDGALALCGQREGYRVFRLSEPPFERIRFAASKREAVIVCLTERPITFTATHPLMCRAFVDFAARLEEHHSMDGQTPGGVPLYHKEVPK